MDGLSACMIEVRIVYGFPGGGKTHYIRDCIRNDYFHKYGSTLILCFERGEEDYDAEELRAKKASVAYYEDGREIGSFCEEQIRIHQPDRIYVERNAHLPDLRRDFPEIMNVTSAVTWIDWTDLESHFADDRQMLSRMVSESLQVTFRNCPSKDLLAPYGQDFQLMNHRASYLREDPMGYHERAFDLFVPYSLDEEKITIRAGEYLVFWLDAAEHPEHYEDKLLCFTDPLELRKVSDDSKWSAGRVVMTCCMADLQFMSFELTDIGEKDLSGGWITMEALGRTAKDQYGKRILKLEPRKLLSAAAPKRDQILQTKRLRGPDPSLSMTMFRQISAAHKTN